MSIIVSSAQTNNADWKTQFQFNDAETGDLIDFTNATIEIDVKDADCCVRIEASTGNGLITIQGTGIIELNVPATTMETLWPGTFHVGGVYYLNGETISLFTGSLTIISGVARI